MSIVYIIEYQSFCAVVPFSTGKAVGGPKSYDSTGTVVLYIIYVLTPFTASVDQWKENFFVRFTR
jgi:hypothetical protein